MSEFAGKDEATLRKLLEKCLNFQERRKIRAALRAILENNDDKQEETPSTSPWKRTTDLALRDYSPSSRLASRRQSMPVSAGSKESTGPSFSRNSFRSESPVESSSSHRSPSPASRVSRSGSLFKTYRESSLSRDATANGFHERGTGTSSSTSQARYDPLATRAEPLRSSNLHSDGSKLGSSSKHSSAHTSALLQTAYDSDRPPSRGSTSVRSSAQGTGSTHSSRADLSGGPRMSPGSPHGSRSPSPFLSRGRMSPVSSFRSGGESHHDSRAQSGSSSYSSGYSTSGSSGYSSGAFSSHSSSASSTLSSRRPPPSPSGVGSAAFKYRHSAAAVMLESDTAAVRMKRGDVDSDLSEILLCTSVEELQNMLPGAVTFRQRRAIKARIRQLQETTDEKGEAHAPATNGTGGATLYRQLSNGSMVENGKVLTSMDIKAADIDIERLESLDELKQLLQSTDEPALKRRIRNAMRQLRQRLENEKARLTERLGPRSDHSGLTKTAQDGAADSGREGILLQFSARDHTRASHKAPRPLVVPRSSGDTDEHDNVDADDEDAGDDGGDVFTAIQRSRERLQRSRSGSLGSSSSFLSKDRESGDSGGLPPGRSSSFRERTSRSGSVASPLLAKDRDHLDRESRSGSFGSSVRWREGVGGERHTRSGSFGSSWRHRSTDSRQDGSSLSASSSHTRESSVSESSDGGEHERDDHVFSGNEEDKDDFLARLKARLNASCITTARSARRGSEPVPPHITKLQHRRGTLLSDSLLEGPSRKRSPGTGSQSVGDPAATASGGSLLAALSSSSPSPSQNGAVSAASGEERVDSETVTSSWLREKPSSVAAVAANGSSSPGWRSSLNITIDSGASTHNKSEPVQVAGKDSKSLTAKEAFASALSSVTGFAASEIELRKHLPENKKTLDASGPSLQSSGAENHKHLRDTDETSVRSSAATVISPSDKAEARSSVAAVTSDKTSERSPSIWSSSYRLQKSGNSAFKDSGKDSPPSVVETPVLKSTDTNRVKPVQAEEPFNISTLSVSLKPHEDIPISQKKPESQKEEVLDVVDSVGQESTAAKSKVRKEIVSSESAVGVQEREEVCAENSASDSSGRGRTRKVGLIEVFPGVTSAHYDTGKCSWASRDLVKGGNSSETGDSSEKAQATELEQAFSALLDDIDTEDSEMSETLGSTISDLNALAIEMESGKSTRAMVDADSDVDLENNNYKMKGEDDIPYIDSDNNEDNGDAVKSSSARIVLNTSAGDTQSQKTMDTNNDDVPFADDENGPDESQRDLSEDQTDAGPEPVDEVDGSTASQEDTADGYSETTKATTTPAKARPTDLGRKISEMDPNGELEDLELMESPGAVVPLMDLHGEGLGSASTTCAISMHEDDDGSVVMRRISKGEDRQRVVTVKKRVYRTPSNARAEDRETIIETQMQTPEGSVVEKKDTVHMKRKITARGSNYYSRNTLITKKVRNRVGAEMVEHDVIVESENKSASKGETWGDRAVSRITLNSPSSLPMLEEAKDAQETKTSEARLVLEEAAGEGEEDKQGSTTRPSGSPEVLSPLKDSSVLEGDAVTLECTVGGTAPLTVAWFLEEDPLEETQGDMQTSFDPGTGKAVLVLKETSLPQAGVYCCVASNEIGEAATKCHLTVKAKPTSAPVFTTGLQDVEVTEGHSVTMTCTVENADVVLWYRDGIVQRNSPDFKQTFSQGRARLEIGEVFLDDVGTYSCVARNDLGETWSSCKLNVTACTSETTVVPMFLTKLPQKTVRNGEDLVLECDVIGSPEPTVTWLKDGAPLRDDVSSDESYDGRVACLRIEGVELADAGKYECVAENPAGRVSMDTTITVQVCNKAPVFASPLSDVTVREGEEVSLRCEVAAVPKPSLFWRKNGTLVGQTPDHRQSFINGYASLHITNLCLQDSGTYECVARNTVGEACCSCQLLVTGKEATQPSQAAPSTHTPATMPERPPAVSKTSVAGLRLAEPPPPQPNQAVAAKIVQRALSFQLTQHRRAELAQAKSSPLAPSPLVAPSGHQRLLPAVPTTQPPTSSVAVTHTMPLPESVPSAQPASSKVSNVEVRLTAPPPRAETVVEPAKVTLRRVSSQNRAADAKVALLKQEEGAPEASKVTLRRTASHSRADVKLAPSFLASVQSSTPNTDSPPPPKSEAVETLTVTLRRAASQGKADVRKPGAGAATFHAPSPLVRDITPQPKPDLNGSVSKVQHDLPPRPVEGLPPKGITSVPAPKPAAQSSAAPQSGGGAVSLVSKLRQQFQANDDAAQSPGSSIRRWHSLPPRQDKPVVQQRDAASSRIQEATTAIMSKVDINTITDEEQLHKMLSSTEDFDERRKIRNRLKDIREKARLDFEEQRKQRDKAAGDVVKLQHDRAEELKRKKMAAFQEAASMPTSARESEYTKVSEKALQDRHRQAEDDKKKKLEAYSKITGHHGTSTTSSSTTTTDGGAKVTTNTTVTTEKSDDGSKTTVTKKTETTVTKTSGMGGMQYGAPGKAGAEQVASQLTKQLINTSGPGVSGRVTVKTESWSSRDGLVNKSEKTETWGGAKPQGARGAMAAFKQMDNTNNPQAASKPKAAGGGGGKGMTRSPSAIKQMLLDWCKAKTAEYETVDITNFSSSWNNGMAFCALIHHFYPDSFDFSKLDPKNRRENFTLAFDTAEKEADIAPLLDVDDMVKMKNPDWKCVFCYVQSIYRRLYNHDANKAKEAAEQ